MLCILTKVNNCYSPADSVDVSLTICAVTPPAQVAITNQPKTGTASTELNTNRRGRTLCLLG